MCLVNSTRPTRPTYKRSPTHRLENINGNLVRGIRRGYAPTAGNINGNRGTRHTQPLRASGLLLTAWNWVASSLLRRGGRGTRGRLALEM